MYNFFRVLLCAVVLIGGYYFLTSLRIALRGDAFVGTPDWSTVASGVALCGLVGLIWWFSEPRPK